MINLQYAVQYVHLQEPLEIIAVFQEPDSFSSFSQSQYYDAIDIEQLDRVMTQESTDFIRLHQAELL